MLFSWCDIDYFNSPAHEWPMFWQKKYLPLGSSSLFDRILWTHSVHQYLWSIYISVSEWNHFHNESSNWPELHGGIYSTSLLENFCMALSPCGTNCAGTRCILVPVHRPKLVHFINCHFCLSFNGGDLYFRDGARISQMAIYLELLLQK